MNNKKVKMPEKRLNVQTERKIEAGELQLVQASEEVTRRNVKMILDYSVDTRIMFRKLEQEVEHLKNIVLTYQGLVDEQNQRIAGLLQIISAGGTNRNNT